MAKAEDWSGRKAGVTQPRRGPGVFRWKPLPQAPGRGKPNRVWRQPNSPICAPCEGGRFAPRRARRSPPHRERVRRRTTPRARLSHPCGCIRAYARPQKLRRSRLLQADKDIRRRLLANVLLSSSSNFGRREKRPSQPNLPPKLTDSKGSGTWKDHAPVALPTANSTEERATQVLPACGKGPNRRVNRLPARRTLFKKLAKKYGAHGGGI